MSGDPHVQLYLSDKSTLTKVNNDLWWLVWLNVNKLTPNVLLICLVLNQNDDFSITLTKCRCNQMQKLNPKKFNVASVAITTYAEKLLLYVADEHFSDKFNNIFVTRTIFFWCSD